MKRSLGEGEGGGGSSSSSKRLTKEYLQYQEKSSSIYDENGPFSEHGEDSSIDDDDDDDDDDNNNNDDDEDGDEEIENMGAVLFGFGKDILLALKEKKEENTNTIKKQEEKALAAFEKCREIVFGINPQLQKLIRMALARPDDDKVAPGSGLLTRNIHDHRFLLCHNSLAIGEFFHERGETRKAYQAFREALVWFPRSTVALLRFTQLLQFGIVEGGEVEEAVNEVDRVVKSKKGIENMERVGKLLKKAVQCAKQIEPALSVDEIENAMDEDPLYEYEVLMLREERIAGRNAKDALALFLLQQNESDEVTKRILSPLGFKMRLSTDILAYSAENKTSSAPLPASIAQAVDSALPPAILSRLRTAFRPASLFWSEHSYDPYLNASRKVGYFSYLYQLKQATATNLVEQAIDVIFQHVCKMFPSVGEECTVAEWWVHSRPHSCGHQLHFDSDETHIEHGGQPCHPLVSTVLYLEDVPKDDEPTGGPTLITNQVLGGPLASKGWLCFPSTSRLMAFDAKYLHGVIPGRGAIPGIGEERRRLSFMVGFWKDIKSRNRGPGNPGPGQPCPVMTSETSSWQTEIPFEPNWNTTHSKETEKRVVDTAPPAPVYSVNSVWDQVDSAQPVAIQPTYDRCFQGF